MFDIAWSELIIIAVVALIVIGPKELPGVLRGIGHWMGKVRRMASEFQGQFQEAMREAEMTDLKKQADDLSAAASDLTSFNPMADAQKEIDSAFAEADKALETPAQDASAETLRTDSAGTDAPPQEPVTSTAPDPAADEPAPKKQAGSGA